MIHYLSTKKREDLREYFNRIPAPQRTSHKGQNGKLLVIGGSELFHAAAIWAAEIASHMVDMVHFSSTTGNNEIMLGLKSIFRNGIVVPRPEIESYIKEDDVVLIGPGMVRSDVSIADGTYAHDTQLEMILQESDEGVLTARLTHYLLRMHGSSKWVIDAGALQMMKLSWLSLLKTPPILTPHQGEFARLFGIEVEQMETEKKAEVACATAAKHGCIILLKAVDDIITDGVDCWVVRGGNAGLAKGGTGDILAGLTSSLYTKTDGITAALVASFLLKSASDDLYNEVGYWYNNNQVIARIPAVLSWYMRHR